MRQEVISKSCLILLLLFSAGLLAQAPPAAESKKPDYSQEASVIESLSRKVEFQNDGTGYTETTLRARIQSDAGVKQFGLLIFQYQQANDTPEITYVRVRKPDGTTVVTPAENIQDLPADVTREAPFYSDVRQKHVAVRGLSVGDTLEYQIRNRTHTPIVPGHFWLAHDFSRSGIVLEETLEVNVPAARTVKTKFVEMQPSVTEEGGRRIYRWKTANLERKKEDESKAEPDEAPPAVQFTTFQSFEEVGRWYESLQSERAEPTPEIRAKAAELIKGAKTDDEKLKAIYNYVSLHFRYIGIAFGIGRYQPNPAADVLANQYGDCKDKHTLLAALLKAAGLMAYPALINSSRQIDPKVPSPAQFDHVISAIPQGDGYLWLDTTPEVAPFALLLFTLRDKQALVISEGKPALLVKTPQDPPFPTTARFQVEGKLDESGTLTAKIERTFRGDMEVLLRAAFRGTPQAQWKDLIQNISYASGFAGTVSKIDVSAPEATDAPFRLSYDYNRKEYPDWANHRISMPCPPYGLPALKDKDEEKRVILKLGVPLEFDYEGKVTVPKDYTPKVPSAVDLKEDFAEYHSTYAFQDGVLRGVHHLTITAKEIPKEKFEAYRKFAKAANEDEARFVDLTPPRLSKAELLSKADGMSADELNSAAASLLDENKDFSLALDLLRKAVAKDPSHKWAWNNLGRAYVRLGNESEAEKAYKKQIEINPKDEYTYDNLGWLYGRQKRYAEAVAAYRKHIELNPTDKEAYGYLGWALGELRKWDEAEEVYSRLVLLSPDKPEPYVSWGRALLHVGKKEEALMQLRKALELDPKYPGAWAMIGYLKVQMGEVDEGLRDFRKEIEVNPQDHDAPAYLGGILIRLKRYSEAVPVLESALEMNPKTTRLTLQLGSAYLESGEAEKAMASYQKAAELDPSPNTWNTIAYDLAEKSQNLQEAHRYAEMAVKAQERRTAEIRLQKLDLSDLKATDLLGAIWDTLGWAYFRLGDLDDAENYISAGWNLTQLPDTADHLGQVYEKQGKKQAAIRAYAWALASSGADVRGRVPAPVIPQASADFPGRGETRQRLLNLIGNTTQCEARVGGAREELSRLRTVKVKPILSRFASAEFFVVISPGPKVEEVKFISGDEGLRNAGDALAAAKFDVLFPADRPAKLLRRGILMCHSITSGCEFVMYPPNSVLSIQ